MPDPGKVACKRCGREISALSDEAREWVEVTDASDYDENFNAADHLVCLDCLTPSEREGVEKLWPQTRQYEAAIREQRRRLKGDGPRENDRR
jgi:hypothetical protein